MTSETHLALCPIGFNCTHLSEALNPLCASVQAPATFYLRDLLTRLLTLIGHEGFEGLGLIHLPGPRGSHSENYLLNKLSELLSHMSFSCGKRQTLLIDLTSLQG